MDEGFEIALLYPVEGDTAIAELQYDGDTWADLRLEGIDVAESGERRIANAKVVIRLYAAPGVAQVPESKELRRLVGRRTYRQLRGQLPPYPDQDWWEFELADAMAQLDRGRELLLENERAREPIEDDEGLTAAARALTKASPENYERFVNPDAGERP